MLQQGQRLILEITDYNHRGHGVARHEGQAVFIPCALRGERVAVQVDGVSKKYAAARLTEILTPSADRIQPVCPHFGVCGGCDLQHMNTRQQAEFKRMKVYNALSRIGGIDDPPVSACIASPRPIHYRNKATLAADGGRMGFYREMSHEVVDIEHCYLQHETVSLLACGLKKYAASFGLSGAVVRTIQSGHQMLILSGSGDLGRLGEKLAGQYPAVKSIYRQSDDGVRLLWGTPQLHDEMCGIEYNVTPQAFLQVNPSAAALLYRQVVEFAALKNDTVLDAYCGTGILTLMLARQAMYAVGVEGSEEAVAAARKNSAANGIGNVEFHAGRCEHVIPRLLADGLSPDVIVLDPPRTGCDKRLLAGVGQAAPSRIVYVSCDPATLARDVKELGQHGYRLEQAIPFDLFVHTSHVECVCLLSR